MDVSTEIAALEARLGVLRSLQTQDAAAADGGKCIFPPAVNFTNWHGLDVRMPHPWCPPSDEVPPARSLEELARDPAWPTGKKLKVLPSLLVPCCAHSGTTFLWRCMKHAYVPGVVCGRPNPRRPKDPDFAESTGQWTAKTCGDRKYLLPGLTGNIQGHWDYRKEWFFYGGGASHWAKGWHEYTGVELPLCYWEPEFQRLLRTRSLDDTLGHSRGLCNVFARAARPQRRQGGKQGGKQGGLAPCIHRACLALDLDKVRLGPEYASEYDRRHKPRFQFQATKALPKIDPRVHTGAVVSDMTPNYLCSPKVSGRPCFLPPPTAHRPPPTAHRPPPTALRPPPSAHAHCAPTPTSGVAQPCELDRRTNALPDAASATRPSPDDHIVVQDVRAVGLGPQQQPRGGHAKAGTCHGLSKRSPRPSHEPASHPSANTSSSRSAPMLSSLLPRHCHGTTEPPLTLV